MDLILHAPVQYDCPILCTDMYEMLVLQWTDELLEPHRAIYTEKKTDISLNQ